MSTRRVCNTERKGVERLAARSVVVAGGLFWVVAAFAAQYSFRGAAVLESAGSALYPLAATIVTLAVGWRYERLASVLLVLGAAGVAAWGALYAWEPFVWLIMSTVIIGPMLLAATLFALAARMEGICELEWAAGEKPSGSEARLGSAA